MRLTFSILETGCYDLGSVPVLAHLAAPTLEEFDQAAQVLESRWPFMRSMHTRARFTGMQQLGLSLVASFPSDARTHMDGVMFLAPNRLEHRADTFHWWSAFQFATLPDAHPATAGLLLRLAMKHYPLMLGVGVTPAADVLQARMGWKTHPQLWRAVHPVFLRRMLTDYGDRFSPLQRRIAGALAGVHDLLAAPLLEMILAAGLRAERRTTHTHPRLAVCATYFDLLTAGPLEVINSGGAARFVSSLEAGSWRQHAALWRELRRRDCKFAEILLFDEASCRRARRFGYLPLAMTNRCWDPQNRMDALFTALRETQATFLVTDKVL